MSFHAKELDIKVKAIYCYFVEVSEIKREEEATPKATKSKRILLFGTNGVEIITKK